MEKRPPMPPDIEQMRLMQAKAQQAEGMPAGQARPEEVIGFVTTPEPTPKRMTKERLTKALHDLDKYRSGKTRLEQRLIEVEQWWKIRHWEWMQEQGAKNDMKTASAWLFNVIVSKHADGVQSIPEANVLPREESDKPTAKMLSSIIPCVLEQNRFDEVYSDVLWQKLKGGTGAYGIFWDKDKHNGLGDISLNRANLLHLYWEPGISDIQDSKQVFYLEKVDEDLLKSQYPELEGENLTGKNIAIRKFKTEDSVTDEGKAVVVDWYYHSYANGRKILHFCKFVNTTVLYATEDDPELAERGLYDHGMYPFVLDALFPVEGSPCGFGYIDVCKNAQEQIDIIDQAIIKNSIINATPRYFIRSDGAVNEQEFMDWTKPLVHVKGNLGEDSVRPMVMPAFNQTPLAVVNNKVGELKETSGNTDSSNGISQNSSQAASAIAALQEASGKVSRASTMSAYRAFGRIIEQVIELIRQFYELPRQFRITGDMGEEQYESFSNAAMQPTALPPVGGTNMGFRMPVFDVKVSAQTKSAYTKAAQNDLAITLYNLGVMNPQMTDQALMLLDMMDFDGKEKLMQKVSQNGTLMQMMAQWQQIALQLAQEHNPMLAEQLAGTVMSGAGMPVQQLTAGAAKTMDSPDPGGAGAKMEKAREQSQMASQP